LPININPLYSGAHGGGSNPLYDGGSSGGYSSSSSYSSNSSPSVTTTEPVRESGSLQQLILLQRANGSFQLTEDFAKMVGKSVKEITNSIPISLQQMKEKETIWATLLAIALFKQKYSEQQSKWKLLYNKATKFIAKETTVSIESLIENAISFL